MNQSEPKWFARVMGRELGPMTRDRLQRMVKDGEITPDDEIRRSNESSWSSANSFIVPDQQPDLVVLEPAVSTIAPLRIPKRASEDRVREIRQRAMAARSSPPHETDGDETAFESDLDAPTLTDDAVVTSDESAAVLSDDRLVNPSEQPVTAPDFQPGAANADYQRQSWSIDALFQSVGRAIRAQSSRRINNGPTLRDGLADLIPTRLFTRTNAMLAAGVVTVCVIAWLLMPGYQLTAFNQLGDLRESVQTALDDPAAANNWSNAMEQLRPEIVSIVKRMQLEATADNPPSQFLLWASTEMNAVIGGSPSESTSHLKKFDDLIAEYTQLTSDESLDDSETGIVELPGGLR
jgi:hypothetical protein